MSTTMSAFLVTGRLPRSAMTKRAARGNGPDELPIAQPRAKEG
jgi:hypothetical protein